MNDLACIFLEIPSSILLTRRFLYWIPAKGEPVKIVHVIEQHSLDHLPGHKLIYRSWQELEKHIACVVEGCHAVAMEYSPNNALPYVSKVDAGTIDFIRACGVIVESSADILQQYTSVLNREQLTTHLAAAEILDRIAAETWSMLADRLKQKQTITEYDVQQFILEKFAQHHCITDSLPICAVNAHSADPHYIPTTSTASPIHPGDFILIDLWCKQDRTDAIYADITRLAVAAAHPTPRQLEIFNIVKKARDVATDFVFKGFASHQPPKGWEVDQICRNIIVEAGYGDCFLHRTGHSIDVRDHGSGANLDNLETQDRRNLLPGTCFSIEPGIYLPGEFGVRLEYDICVHQDSQIQVTGGIQEQIISLLNH